MPEIIPNTHKYLDISDKVLGKEEDYLIFSRKGRSHIAIMGLNEWLKRGKRGKEAESNSPVENSTRGEV